MCRREAGEPRPQSCRCRFDWRSRCEFLGHARLGATLRPPCPQRAVVARHVASPMCLFGVARDPAGRRGLSVPSARTHRTHRAGGLVPHPLRDCGVGAQQAGVAGGRGFPGEGTFSPEAGSVSAAGTNSGRSAVSLPGRRGGSGPLLGPRLPTVCHGQSRFCAGGGGDFQPRPFHGSRGCRARPRRGMPATAAASRGGSFHTAAHPKVLHYLSFSYPEVPPFVVSLCAKGPGDSCTEMGLLILILMLLPPPLLCGLSVGDNASSSFHSASGDPACLSATCPAAGPPACGPHTPQWPQTALPF